MRRQKISRACQLRSWMAVPLAVAALPGAAFAAAPQRCERLVGGIDFPRQLLFPDQPMTAVVPIAPDGALGLAVQLRQYREPPLVSRDEVALALRNSAGALHLSPAFDFNTLTPRRESGSLFPGDFDADGLTDLVVRAVGGRNFNTLEFFHGAADGALAPPVTFELGPMGYFDAQFSSGDFDGDGALELVQLVAGFYESTLTLFEIVDGTWVRAEPMTTVATNTAVAAVDWNEDGIDDLALAMPPGYSNYVVVRFGDREQPLVFGEWLSFAHPVLSVLSRDKRLNVVDGSGYYYFRYVDGLEEWRRSTTGDRKDRLWRIDFENRDGYVLAPLDVDADAEQDLILSHAFHPIYYGPAGFRVYWADGTDEPQLGYDSASSSYPIASVDIDGDATRDLVLDDFSWAQQTQRRQVDDGLRATSFEVNFVDEPYAHTVVGDFNEDGLDDVVLQTFFADVFRLGFARGDGSFRLEVVPFSPYRFLTPQVSDLDADGHLDLLSSNRELRIAWGRGDGTFEWPNGGGGYATQRLITDLDGDGDRDFIELRRRAGTYDQTDAVPVLLEQRVASEQTSTPLGDVVAATIGDLDGDGRSELIYSRPDPGEFRPRAILARHVLQGCLLGPEWEVFRFEGDRRVGRLRATDVDFDGVSELLVRRQDTQSTSEVGLYTSLRSNGVDRFEEIWSGSAAKASFYYVPEDWVDIDGDGRLDIVTGQSDPYLAPFYALHVRRGDGFGRFLPEEPLAWSGFLGQIGNFRTTAGRDLVRIRVHDLQTMHVELLASREPVLDEDLAPPSTLVEVDPVIDRSVSPARLSNRWRVSASPYDDCDSAPRVQRRMIEMLPVVSDTTVTFRRSTSTEIRIYERPNAGTTAPVREVLLLGPNERAMRALYDQARAAGGFVFAQHAVLELTNSVAYGSERGPRDDKSRLAQRLRFEGGRLLGAAQSHPQLELRFAIVSNDRSGKVGTTDVPFRIARQQALQRLCAETADQMIDCSR